MNRQTTRQPETLLFQKLFVSSSRNPSRSAVELDIANRCATRLIGQGKYVPVALSRALGDSRSDVVFYATEGMAAVEEFRSDDTLRAIYLLRGAFDKTAETMSKLHLRGDIDFEGTMQHRIVIEQRIATLEKETGNPRVVRGSQQECSVVNRLDGEQSEFFSRVEDIAIVTGTFLGDNTSNVSSLEYEKLLRMGVSTLRRAEPRLHNKSDLQSASVLGEGVLIWPSVERQSDRYGFVWLLSGPIEGSEHIALRLDDLVDLEGALICEVLEARQSKIADCFRGFSAETPDEGELIELGQGTLTAGENNSVGLSPNDGREIDWLNPDALYRCHLQTVRLYFLRTTAPVVEGKGAE